MKKIFVAVCIALSLPLIAQTNVLIFSGSLRADSCNKKLAQFAAQAARELGATVTEIDLKDFPMPFFDADIEAKEGMPENAKRLRDLMISHDSIVIATPEYNASIPAVLKNAIDWASRSQEGGGSKEAFRGKKIAIMSAAAGGYGGARALVHLRAILEDVGANVVEQQVTVARAYVSGAVEKGLRKNELRNEIKQLIETDQLQ